MANTKNKMVSLLEKKERIIKKINNTLKEELLKEENLIGSPKRLKEVVKLFGAEYNVYSKKVNNIFFNELEITLELTEEYLCNGHLYKIRCNMYREVDMGLVKPISTATVGGVLIQWDNLSSGNRVIEPEMMCIIFGSDIS